MHEIFKQAKEEKKAQIVRNEKDKSFRKNEAEQEK